MKFVTRRQIQKDRWGDCHWQTRTIRVRRDLSLRNVLDTLIHEMRHAQHPVMFEAEGFIDSTSTELAEGLLRSGIVG